MPTKTKVLVVDDSAVVRKVLTDQLSRDPGLEVIAAVADPLLAIERMKITWPDVIVLDVEMPRMDGITFLRKIMAEKPTPVVICSTLTEKGAETTMQALSAGAVSFVTKPKIGLKDFLTESAAELISAVKTAAKVNAKAIRRGPAPMAAPAPKLTADAVLPSTPQAMARTTERFIAIGTSTGGTQALEEVLMALPRVCPGIVIVQHMPEKFTASFAQRLDSLCQIDVKEAVHGDRVMPGRALIAPGGKHMLVQRSGAYYQANVIDGPVVNRHRPSVDVLFRSVAQQAGRNCLGVIMTGMGDDGARGMKELHDVGARTIAQDEATCVVYGMPKEAVKLGAVDHIVPLNEIAREILRFAGQDFAIQRSEVRPVNLVELIYTSRMTKPLSMTEIVELLDKARTHNTRNGLTGMLTFGADRFLQALEGPPAAVNELYERIVTDPRHEDVQLLGYHAVPHRRFSRWSMGFYAYGVDGSLARAGLPDDQFEPQLMTLDQAMALLADMATQMEFAAA